MFEFFALFAKGFDAFAHFIVLRTESVVLCTELFAVCDILIQQFSGFFRFLIGAGGIRRLELRGELFKNPAFGTVDELADIFRVRRCAVKFQITLIMIHRLIRIVQVVGVKRSQFIMHDGGTRTDIEEFFKILSGFLVIACIPAGFRLDKERMAFFLADIIPAGGQHKQTPGQRDQKQQFFQIH